MNNEEIESLLRRAHPQELPAGLKHRILQAARQNAEPIAWAPRVTWASLAVCWMLIVLLRATTPDVPTGTLPFDREAQVHHRNRTISSGDGCFSEPAPASDGIAFSPAKGHSPGIPTCNLEDSQNQ